MLPITDIFSALEKNLEAGNAIVVAPPGAGKSTALPLHLLTLTGLTKRKIIMLQPRRVAARNIAVYLSAQLNETVGQTVGYRVRGENKISANTRLEIVTEGILTRMLQSSPELPDVGLIIFDEFHERSVHADFSLALCLEVQQALRDDLRLLIMSATLDTAALNQVLPRSPVLESIGKSHTVDIRHVQQSSAISLVAQVKQVVLSVFHQHTKDILVFLPGANEIKQVAALLEVALKDQAKIHFLFSNAQKEQQQRAILPDPEGKRKIVLATNIAETSLTIEGIEVVVDSGIEKRGIFDLTKGITHLTTQRISQASATQRAGRAGRLMPGTCYRLWSKEQHDRLARQSTPEILQTDIASFVLDAAVWGSHINDLALIDHPSKAQLSQAKDNLQRLGLLDPSQKVSALGRQVNQLGCDVMIASMLLQSATLGTAYQSMACAIAAILESKDPLSQSPSVEVYDRLTFLLEHRHHSIWQLVRQWHKKLGITMVTWPLEAIGDVLALGFSQWIAKQTSKGRFLLANGSGANMAKAYHHSHEHEAEQALLAHDWIVVCHMQINDRQSHSAIIRYAQGINEDILKRAFSGQFNEVETCEWDKQKQKISASKSLYFEKIQVSKVPLSSPSKRMTLATWRGLLVKKLESEGLSAIPFDKRTQQLMIRTELAKRFVQTHSEKADLPDFSANALIALIEQWALPYLEDKTTWQQFANLPFYQMMSGLFTYQQLIVLNHQLPETWMIPTGREVGIEYFSEGKAVLAVRMQEMYGLKEHPSILNGTLALTCELLSPAQRPLQTTQDIVGFFSGSYKQIQKEMKGRYPKHFWPDDPANAKATAAIKKKM